MNKNTKILIFGAPLFAILLVAIRVYYSLVIWTYQGPDKIFDIMPGDNFSKINSHLSEEKLISSARLFHRYCQFKNVLTKFKTGRFVIRQNANMLEVFNILINEKSLALMFTVPEGKNIYEIGKMLEERNIVKYQSFMEAVRDPEILKEFNIDSTTAEGYLYPETYSFVPNIDAKKIVKLMIELHFKKLKNLDYSKTQLSPKDVLILASIVEKETGDKKERPMIAGVFHNRLNIKMRLQSDPTTIYGMYSHYNGNITKKDLLTPSDYNTYTIAALPVGPICNPGLEAINAVISPAKHKFLYFVSQNDGTHIFSEKYEDHQKAVNNWQKNSKNREGRSWRNHSN